MLTQRKGESTGVIVGNNDKEESRIKKCLRKKKTVTQRKGESQNVIVESSEKRKRESYSIKVNYSKKKRSGNENLLASRSRNEKLM